MLQEREIIPVGGTHPVKVDVRIVAATNRDLEEEVALGNFRADLYYRLNVIPLSLPPLRDRADDVPLLVDHFLQRYSPDYDGGALATGIRDDALELLGQYSWPGNVRELENVIERAVILREETIITPHDLPAKLLAEVRGRGKAALGASGITLDELERRYMLQVLDETGWHKKRAAEILGINPSTLYRKIKSFGLEAPEGLGEADDRGPRGGRGLSGSVHSRRPAGSGRYDCPPSGDRCNGMVRAGHDGERRGRIGNRFGMAREVLRVR